MKTQQKVRNEIELSIVASGISRKSNMMIIAEVVFIDKCLKIKERDDLLSVLFFDDFITWDTDVDVIKESLLTIKTLLMNEFNFRQSN